MKKEVLWGTDEEINNYMFDLFEHLILEVFSDQNEYNLDIEKYLCDYIPYAKNSTYWEVIVKGIYPAMFYGVSEDKILYFLLVKKQFDLYITDALHHLKIISSLLLKIKNHFAELIRYLKHHLLTINSFH